MKLHTLSPLIMQTARLAGQSVQRERLDDIDCALASAQASDAADALVRRAWSAANLSGLPSRLTTPRPKDCPFIGWHATEGWFVVVSKSADGSWQVQNSQGSLAWIADLREVECVSLPAKAESGVRASPKASHIVWQAIWQR